MDYATQQIASQANRSYRGTGNQRGQQNGYPPSQNYNQRSTDYQPRNQPSNNGTYNQGNWGNQRSNPSFNPNYQGGGNFNNNQRGGNWKNNDGSYRGNMRQNQGFN